MQKRQNIVFRLRRFGSIIPRPIARLSRYFTSAAPSATRLREARVQCPCLKLGWSLPTKDSPPWSRQRTLPWSGGFWQGLPDRVLAPQVTFLAFEIVQADQKFLIVDEFLFSIRERINSWGGLEKLKVFSLQILAKDTAYILSSSGFLCLFF